MLKKTSTLFTAFILFLIPAFEIGRWIYITEKAEKFSEARAKYFAPYPEALQNNTISTWIFFILLVLSAIVFFANSKRGIFFILIGILASVMGFWMLFSLM